MIVALDLIGIINRGFSDEPRQDQTVEDDFQFLRTAGSQGAGGSSPRRRQLYRNWEPIECFFVRQQC